MGSRRPNRDQEGAARALAQRLGHEFANVQLLHLALVHRSAFAEEQLAESNERLEFLGDSVLGLVITDALYRRRSEQAEGRLARARAELVDETTLADARAGLRAAAGAGRSQIPPAGVGGRSRPRRASLRHRNLRP